MYLNTQLSKFHTEMAKRSLGDCMVVSDVTKLSPTASVGGIVTYISPIKKTKTLPFLKGA